MFNVLDFIDSPDIREYNKDYEFAPSEQAVLVVNSESKTIYEKIEALKELMESYSIDEFKPEFVEFEHITKLEETGMNFKEIIQANIEYYEDIIKDDVWTYDESPLSLAYIAYVMYNEDICVSKFNKSYKNNYAYALRFLCDRRHEIDEDIHPTFCIEKQYLNYNAEDKFMYDEDLRLIFVSSTLDEEKIKDLRIPRSDISEIDLTKAYIYVPTPFRKHDKVMQRSIFKQDLYGTLARNAPLSRYDKTYYPCSFLLPVNAYGVRDAYGIFVYEIAFNMLNCYSTDGSK